MVQTKLSFRPEFMTAFRSKPYPVIFLLLLFHYCASSSYISASFALKNEALANMTNKRFCASFCCVFPRECLQTLAYNLPVELVGVRLLMDGSDFWQPKYHMALNGFQESSHMSKIFLGKNQLRQTGVSVWLRDVMARCSSCYAVFVIRVSLIPDLRPLRSLSFVLPWKFL